VLIIWESSICAFLLTILLQFYLDVIPCISFYSCTCWVPTISVLNLAISPCCTNLLLRRWRWTEILRRWVLGYALPWLLFLWHYGVFHCFTSQESRLSFWRHYLCNKYTIFMTFGYLWTLCVRVCGINDPGHTCDEYLVLLAKSSMTDSNDDLIFLESL
jgi:hypothetical protein